MTRLLSLLKGYKLQQIAVILLGTGTVLAGVGLMTSSGYLISRAAERPMIVDLFAVTAAVRFFGISRAVVRYFERVISHDLTFKILRRLRSLFYEKLEPLAPAQLMGRRAGDLLTRIVSDVDTLQNVYLRVISPSIVAVLVTIITCGALLFFSPRLSLAAFVFLFLNGVGVPLLITRLAKGLGREQVRGKSDMNAYLVDRLQGIHDLLSFNRADDAKRDVGLMQSEVAALQKKQSYVTGLQDSLSTFCAHAGMFTVLIVAIPIVVAGEIQGVMLALLTLGVLTSFEAVQSLGTAYQHLEASKESSRRIYSITDRRPAVQSPDTPAPLPEQFQIGFDSISFSYKEEFITIDDVSFSIPHGGKTAIVGPTGCGKSTLVHLLMRFWNPDKGKITVGNADIRSLDVESLRSCFSVVSQDTYIFNKTLRENLKVADHNAEDEHLLRILQEVGLSDLLNGSSPGLELMLGDQGMRLSGGERQRLSIARALLKNAPVFLIDEPTANLDTITEHKILKLLHRYMHDRTTLFITHRLTGMDRFDQILVMDRGKIIERGSHDELLQHMGLYKRMHAQQQELLTADV